jgi:large subunit ribosomal protein L31
VPCTFAAFAYTIGSAADSRVVQLATFQMIWSVSAMKDKIHPKYFPEAKVYYRGEVVMTVGATVPEMHVEIWSGSHPFFTGKSSFVDTAGRVEKFQKKYAGDYFKKPGAKK